jgi:hypothetical protein
VPSALELVIKLSNEDKPEGLTPPVGGASIAPVISTAPTASVASATNNWQSDLIDSDHQQFLYKECNYITLFFEEF